MDSLKVNIKVNIKLNIISLINISTSCVAYININK